MKKKKKLEHKNESKVASHEVATFSLNILTGFSFFVIYSYLFHFVGNEFFAVGTECEDKSKVCIYYVYQLTDDGRHSIFNSQNT